MSLYIPKRINVEDFVIKNNIIEGVNQDFDLTQSIGEHILNTLSSRPHHVGQIEAETGSQMTFADMKNCSVRCAIWLEWQGLSSNDIVVVCSRNNLDLYAPIFGTLYVGGIFSGWNPFALPLKSAQRLMKLFKPKIIFAGEDVVDTLQKAAKLEDVNTKFVVFGQHSIFQSFHDILRLPTKKQLHSFRPQKIENPRNSALIVLTSGSTGFPKGVVHTYENLLRLTSAFSAISVSGVALWYSTCDWITGFMSTLQSVLLFDTRILHDANLQVEETCRIIEKYKVTKMLASTILMSRMLKTNALKRYSLKSLKFLRSSGGKLSSHILQGFRDALPHTLVCTAYGMSEIGRYIAGQTDNSKSLDSVGFLGSCFQLKIVDEKTRKILGPNQPGEICVKSPAMMAGYYNNSEATRAVLDDEGWLHTGDKGFYDENGELHVLERLKEMMKYQVYQISPSELQEVLLSHPAVMEVSVVPIPHYEDIDWPVAFVKKVPDFHVTEKELVQLSRSVLGEIKKLHGGVRFLEELPKTSSGKINRLLLKAMAKEMAIKH